MGNISGRSFYIVALCIFSQSSSAQEKAISAGVAIQQIYDSNFSQNQLEDEEHITLTSAGVGFKKVFSRQQILARGRVSNYEHYNYSEFDSTIGDAQFSWKGKWLSQVNTEVEAVRDERLAERVEFFERDVIRRDHAKVNLGYGNDGRLAFHVGGKKIEQSHSNFLRESLDFEESIAFVDAGYKTANESTVVLKLTSGEVTYINEDSEISRDSEIFPDVKYVARDLDFEYRQYELESVWAISSKTEITLTLAQLDRDGFINDGSSEVAALNVQWEATPKLKLQGSYSYRQPAVGEMSDSPTNVQIYVISASWQISEKFGLNSSATVREKKYDYEDVDLDMVETLYNVSPLVITYTPTYALSIVLETGWRENTSLISYREYSSFQSALSIKLLY